MVLVEKAERNTERAMYRILDTAGFFGPDDTLYEENSEIYFDGVPCEQMEPLNALARERYINMIEHLEDEGRKAAEKAGRPYSGRPRTLDGALVIATAIQRQEMSVMGSKEKDVSSIKAVEQKTAELGARKRGRPRKDTLAAVANA